MADVLLVLMAVSVLLLAALVGVCGALLISVREGQDTQIALLTAAQRLLEVELAEQADRERVRATLTTLRTGSGRELLRQRLAKRLEESHG